MSGKDLSGISRQEFEEQQHILDVEKWLASERAGYDLCGTFPWCALCVKAEKYPCAKAKFRSQMEQAMDELVDEIIEREEKKSFVPPAEDESAKQEDAAALREIAEDEIAAADLAKETDKAIPDGYEYVVRYRRSFRSKLIQSELLQGLYTEIKNSLLTLGGVRTRMCHGSENFRAGDKKIAKLVAGSKKLWLYLALDPNECDEARYRFEDVSDVKAHRETPVRVKITGSRSLKRAKELIAMLEHTYGLADVGCIYTDFRFPYRTDEQLVAEGLIKPYTALVKIKTKK